MRERGRNKGKETKATKKDRKRGEAIYLNTGTDVQTLSCVECTREHSVNAH